jgi:hypothetical protein
MSTQLRIAFELDHPRVLVSGSRGFVRRVFESGMDQREGTWRAISGLDEVDSSEWDCLITDEGVSAVDWTGPTSPAVQRELASSVRVFYSVRAGNHTVVDAEGHGSSAVILSTLQDVPGSQLREASSAPGEAQLRASALEALQARPRHVGLERNAILIDDQPDSLRIDPFFVGPGDLALAGIYNRSGLQHFFIGADFPDLGGWLQIAFNAWHEADPVRFPGPPNWLRDEMWLLPDETALADSQRQDDLCYETARKEYEARSQARSRKIKALYDAHDAGLRRLLTAHGDELATQVRLALEEIGFVVQEMDESATPGMRREDLRISIPGDSQSWIGLVEVTGSSKGIPQSKIMEFDFNVQKYLVDRQEATPFSKWLVVNQQVAKDPRRRHETFNADVKGVFSDGGGLIIEASALFVLVANLRSGSTSASSLRRRLRQRRGTITIHEALELCADAGEIPEQGEPLHTMDLETQ